MKKTILLICFVLLTALPSIAQETPEFDGYKITVQEFKPKKADLKSNPQAKKYRKFLHNSTKNGVNFAGQYVLIGWQCGNGCARYAIIDAKTGKVFLPEKLQNVSYISDKNSFENLVDYKADSKLLVLNQFETGKTAESGLSAKTRYYEWTGTELKEVEIAKTQSSKVSKGIVSRVILPEFESAILGMDTKTQVPLLLPSEIPSPKFLPKMIPVEEGNSKLSFYSNVLVISDKEYDLSIDITPDCKGRPNCNYGHITGKKNSSASPVNMTNIEYDAQKAQPVILAKDVKGFYTPAPDDPTATRGAQVIWLDGMGNQYAVSLKRAPKEDVISMANSAINNFFAGK